MDFESFLIRISILKRMHSITFKTAVMRNSVRKKLGKRKAKFRVV